MNRDLFRQITLKHLSYQTSKKLSLAFRAGNVLSKTEKLHKYSVGQGIKWCITRGRYESFLELVRGIDFTRKRRKGLKLIELLELARDSSQIIIFDYLWHLPVRSSPVPNSLAILVFTIETMRNSDLPFNMYLWGVIEGQLGGSYWDKLTYAHFVEPEKVNHLIYDWIHIKEGHPPKRYALLDDRPDLFNQLVTRDIPWRYLVRSGCIFYYLRLSILMMVPIVAVQILGMTRYPLLISMSSMLFWLLFTLNMSVNNRSMFDLGVMSGLLCTQVVLGFLTFVVLG